MLKLTNHECWYAECHNADICYVCFYAKFDYAECHNTEYWSADCNY